MTNQQLRRELLDGVGHVLNPIGFRLQRSKARFARKRVEVGVTDYYYLIMLSGEDGDRILACPHFMVQALREPRFRVLV